MTGGGAERVISVLANELCTTFNVEIVTLKQADIFYDLDQRINITCCDDSNSKVGCIRTLKTFFKYRKYIKSTSPDVVIPFTSSAYIFSLVALLFTGIKQIASERNDPNAGSVIKKYISFLVLSFADAFVVQTNSMKKIFPSWIQKKTTTIYNPVNENINKYARSEYLVDDRIVAVGRLVEQKNHLLLIRAFAEILKIYPTLKLEIYGKGPLKGAIEYEIQLCNMEDSVTLCEPVKNIFSKIVNSRLFVLSSNYEGMSNAMIEAMCLQVPIVSTNVSGVDEIIDNGKNGIIVDINNQNQLQKAIESVICDRQLAVSMSNHSSYKSNIFAKDVIVQQWKELINNIN